RGRQQKWQVPIGRRSLSWPTVRLSGLSVASGRVRKPERKCAEVRCRRFLLIVPAMVSFLNLQRAFSLDRGNYSSSTRSGRACTRMALKSARETAATREAPLHRPYIGTAILGGPHWPPNLNLSACFSCNTVKKSAGPWDQRV